MSKPDRATTERNAKTLRELVRRPENKVCADCKRNDPRWASWNLGVFLCIRCSGIHRGMGTHISKVKSVDLDVWTPEQMDSIQKWGNKRANLYWEAHLKAGHVPPEQYVPSPTSPLHPIDVVELTNHPSKMESFIRSKYESRRWAMDGAPPSDPSILEGGQAAGPSQPIQQQQSAPAPPPVQQQQQRTHTSTNSFSASRAPTTRQPQGQHQLLSSAYTTNARGTPPPPVAAAAAPAPAAPAPAAASQDLFSLDFTTPSPSATPAQQQQQQPKKDVKQDIMALFSSPPSQPAAASSAFASFASPSTAAWGSAVPQQQQAQAAQPTSMIGNAGVGAWGASSGWGAPAVPQQPTFASNSSLWGSSTAAPPPVPVQQASLFNTSDVWGGSASSTTAATSNPSQDLFGGLGSVAPAAPAKKDDAFGDIWGGFK